MKAGNTISQARTIDTLQITNLRIGTSTTAGFVPIADARGVMTLSSIAGATAATPTGKGVWYREPIQVSIDTATTLAADTTWFWKNSHGVASTLDSIQLDASTDNFVLVFMKRNEHGGGVAIVDTVTAATNGTNTFYITDATFTTATISATQWLGFKRPTVAAERASFLVFYH